MTAAIEGMAGVGKTQLAIHAGYLIARELPFDRVLFVNLRGFHPDPAQPPVDPAAVLDGFLRLLGVSGQKIPHDLEARVALYRRQLADIRALVILDNAADADQVRPLLPETPGHPVLVTSRRSLTDLHPAARLAVDVFTHDEARRFLAQSAAQVPAGKAAHTAGHPADALTHHNAADTIATDTGSREQQARAHAGLGHAHQTLGDPVLAHEHLQHALTLYTELGMPEADQIRTHLHSH